MVSLSDIQRTRVQRKRGRGMKWRKDNEQSLQVTTANQKVVTLYFANKSFRKHFLLPSKSGVNQDVKASRLANKRASPYRFDDYGQRTFKNTIIDVSRSNINTIINHMATALVGWEWEIDDEAFVRFDFGRDIVRQTHDSPQFISTIRFGIECTAKSANSYEFTFTHCTGS